MKLTDEQKKKRREAREAILYMANKSLKSMRTLSMKNLHEAVHICKKYGLVDKSVLKAAGFNG